jgi:hypothetical protein
MKKSLSEIQLTTKKSSYVHSLTEKNSEIENSYYDRTVSTLQFKEVVRNIVLETNNKTESNKSESTKRFLLSLDRQKSKDGILQLVWNSRMKGDGLGVV